MVGFIMWLDVRKMAGIILILSLLLPSKVKAQPERPNGAGVIVAIVVTVVGGVVIFKVVNFCQNHFPRQAPPDTNAPPSLEVTDFYAASTSYSSIGVCYEPVGLLASDPIPTVVEFTGYFTADHSFRMETGQRMPEATESVDLYELGDPVVRSRRSQLRTQWPALFRGGYSDRFQWWRRERNAGSQCGLWGRCSNGGV